MAEFGASMRPMSSGSDANLREQMERTVKESKWLRQRVEQLERENFVLKKSVYDLSTRLSALSVSRHAQPIILDPQPMDVNRVGLGTESGEANGIPNPTSPLDAHLDFSARGKDFYLKYDLKGHTGAVYAVQFSQCARYLATGSFDKTVRLWDAVNSSELRCLQGHTLNISDVDWTPDSCELLSGAYDQTCRTWDIETGRALLSFDGEGFIQCVQYNPKNTEQFFFGTTRKALTMVDKRKAGAVTTVYNDAMVNTLHIFRDGLYVLTGDSSGALKTWDIRSGRCIQTALNETTKKPISHIAMYKDDDGEPRYMAVNSYDNVIRVYDRGLDPVQTPLKLLHTLKGCHNKNWPIKSAFYQGRQSPVLNRLNERVADLEDVLFDSTSLSRVDSLLLATGSADSHVYVYSMTSAASAISTVTPLLQQSDAFGQKPPGSTDLVQRLNGHTDRVYAVDFHPTDAVLASCSADFTVKLWAIRRRDVAPPL